MSDLHVLIFRKDFDLAVELLEKAVYPQELAAKTNENGLTALHYAVCRNVNAGWLELVRLLVSLYPKALEIKNSNGNLPLHTLFRRNIQDGWLECVQLFVETFPKSLEIENSHGHLPFHTILMRQRITPDADESIAINTLIDKYPAACQASIEGTFPIHLLCRNPKYSLEVFQVLINKISSHHDNCLMVEDGQGRLPIHLLTELSITRDELAGMIFFLLQMSPTCVSVASKTNGRLPMHQVCLCFRGVRDEATLEEIISMYPECLEHKDKNGSLPIHYAAKVPHLESMRLKSYLALFGVLYSKYNFEDLSDVGCLVHSLIDSHYCIEKEMIIEKIIKEFPSCLTIANRVGDLVIHRLVVRHYSSQVRQAVNLRPGILQQKNHYGSLPIHYASDCSDRFLALAAQDPSTLLTKDADGYLPITNYLLAHKVANYKANAVNNYLCLLEEHFAGAYESILKTDNEDLTTKIKILRADLTSLQAELFDLKRKEKESTAELDRLESTVSDLTEKLTRANNEIESSNSKVATLEQALVVSSERENDFRKKVVDPESHASVTTLKVVASSLKSRLDLVRSGLGTNSKPHMTDLVFDSFIKDSDVTAPAMRNFIGMLEEELQVAEKETDRPGGSAQLPVTATPENGSITVTDGSKGEVEFSSDDGGNPAPPKRRRISM